MNKTYLAILITLVLILPMISANLGTYKSGDVVPIRVLSNCSSVNLSEVNGKVINQEMINIAGQTWSYNYNLTTDAKAGTYAYSWNPDCIDCGTDECGNSFEVTPSGFKDTLGFYIVILLIGTALIVLGFKTEDLWFIISGGIIFMLIGLYSINYGIAGQRDMFITWGLGLFEIFMGGYLTIKAGLETTQGWQ